MRVERLWAALPAALVVGLVAMPAAPGIARVKTTQAAASSSHKSKAASVPAKDRNFVKEAGQGGLMEVILGRIATKQAQNSDVKQFGERMVTDHSKGNQALAQVASQKGLSVPKSLDRKHQKDVSRLQKQKGAAFDKAYMAFMVKDHTKDVSDFKKEAAQGKDPDVKSFASQTIPTLQEHLNMARQAASAVGASVKSGKRQKVPNAAMKSGGAGAKAGTDSDNDKDDRGKSSR